MAVPLPAENKKGDNGELDGVNIVYRQHALIYIQLQLQGMWPSNDLNLNS